jgi:hypothetical protein
MWGGSDRTHRRSNPGSVLEYLQNGKIILYPEAGHFPELEDPESLKSLLAKEELWNGLRNNQGERAAEVGLRLVEDIKPDKISIIDIGDHDRGEHPGELRLRRKPPDSHL